MHKRPTRLPTRGARSPTAWVRGRTLSKGAFLGAIPGLRHSRARLPLFPPTPFSHTGRRGSLGVLMAETGDGTQGIAKKSTPVRSPLPRSPEPCRGKTQNGDPADGVTFCLFYNTAKGSTVDRRDGMPAGEDARAPWVRLRARMRAHPGSQV